MKATRLFKDFFNSEKAGGLLLIICALLSLVISNVSFGASYQEFWENSLGPFSISHWINDGLMSIFFLLIGLELEREIYHGELSKPKDALFPLFGAMGGMLIPALIFLLFNWGLPTQSGAGIPMATDIAFAIGILSLLGNQVPTSLKLFLTALAVIDDLGAIIMIAIFYTQTIVWIKLFLALAIWSFLLILNRLRIHQLWPYLISGIALWIFMYQSGVHATITGVLLAFAIPFGNGSPTSPSYKLQHVLHQPVAFIILPLFAIANTAIPVSTDFNRIISQASSLGVGMGLLIGKPLRIFLFSFLAVQSGICKLPSDLNWKSIIGVGFLGGIGFTMSIFITLLAFNQLELIQNTKLVILLYSCLAGLLGWTILHFALKRRFAKSVSNNHE